jgi:chemotaxis protein CheD
MLHVMLPTAGVDKGTPIANPYKFVDTGLPRLFLDSYKLGARKERLIVKVAGGASTKESEEDDYFQIGKRNFLMLKKLLWKNSVILKAHDVGGNNSHNELGYQHW